MIYTIKKATQIADLLKRFTSGYAHHVVGQFANLDFWLYEVKAALQTLDQYNKRFVKMRDAQKDWVDAHGTMLDEYCTICQGKCEFGSVKPDLPVRADSVELKEARRDLVDATYFFLLRCYRMRLLNKKMLANKCREIGTSIDPSDLEK